MVRSYPCLTIELAPRGVYKLIIRAMLSAGLRQAAWSHRMVAHAPVATAERAEQWYLILAGPSRRWRLPFVQHSCRESLPEAT